MGSNIYDGILKPGPQGGIYNPGADVQFPQQAAPASVSRVTPEGLNVNAVQTVAIDPRTGNPTVTVGGKTPSAHATGMAQAAYVPGPSGSLSLTKDVSRLNPGTALAFGDGTTSPGLNAISRAVVAQQPPSPAIHNGASIANGARGFLMNWQPAQSVAPAPAGDPWASVRFGEAVAPRFGMVTGSAPVATRAMPIMAASAPTPVAAPVAPAGSSYLAAQGVNTSGMTVGQVANELNKSMEGSSRNADGTRGFM